MYKTIDAAIMAGGRSSRMGKDKALLPFGGFGSLAEYQYRRLKRIFENVYMCSKTHKFDFDAETILDDDSTSSPLAGIVSALKRSGKDLFVLGVDMPFVDRQVIKILTERYLRTREAEDPPHIVMAESSGGKEPLCAIYSYSVMDELLERLGRGEHRLRSLDEDCRIESVLFGDAEKFANMNHPSEYEKCLEKFKKESI